MRYVFDTNAIIDFPHLLELEGEIIVPIIVVNELDNLKNKYGEIGQKARQGIRNLKKCDKITYDLDYDFSHPLRIMSGGCVDNVIIECAKSRNAVFVSGDYAAQLKAKSINIEVYETDRVTDFYKGYIQRTLSDEELAEVYENSTNNFLNLLPNQYLLVEGGNGEIVDKLRWNGEKHVKLKLPNIKGLKSKHYLQECAMDLLNNTDITTKIILGTYGSGKTFLSTKISLSNVLEKGKFAKLLVVREPIGEGKEIGFLKGSKDDKTADFFKPIEQSLDGSFFQMQDLETRGVIEKEIPYFLKGTTYNETVILVDEAEDMTYKQLKLIGTRVGLNSNIVFSGDYKQAVHDNSINNGLIQLVNRLKGNPLFGVIDLVEDVRSETSKMFAELE